MGTVVYRVTGTIGGVQRKKQFQHLADAEATRDAWEVERIAAAAALRPKLTRLTKAQLEEAEACFLMLDGSDYTLRDAVKAHLAAPPAKPCTLSFKEAYEQFLTENRKSISKAQAKNYLSPCHRLADYLGHETRLRDVTAEKVNAWLESMPDLKKKSWNNYRGDLAVVFNWFMADPRAWMSKNPVHAVTRFRKRDTLPGPIEAMTVRSAREMMAWLEDTHPHWVTFFALAVFAGVRPDREDGEFWKLSKAIETHGMRPYFREGKLHISAQVSKDGRPRTVPLSKNLQKWLERYPVTPQSLLGGDRAEYAAIRAKWEIPHDGLRHTSISACTALHGIAETVRRHGNSERICLDHYLDLFTKPQARAFYAISPMKAAETTERDCPLVLVA